MLSNKIPPKKLSTKEPIGDLGEMENNKGDGENSSSPPDVLSSVSGMGREELEELITAAQSELDKLNSSDENNNETTKE